MVLSAVGLGRSFLFYFLLFQFLLNHVTYPVARISFVGFGAHK